MKYMLIMRATDAAVEAAKSMPMEEMLNQMGAYNEELMGAGVMVGGEGLALEIVDTWLDTKFSHNERHQRRIDKVMALEN